MSNKNQQTSVHHSLRVRTSLRGGDSSNACKFLANYCKKIPLNQINEECSIVKDSVCALQPTP
jgi:hypothetical protein